MAQIPGEATEIRYQRTGPLAGRYYHRFRPGVRMHANRDGSVTLRGPAKLHAVESEPGFWSKYTDKPNPRRRRAAPRRASGGGGEGGGGGGLLSLCVLTLFWLWFRASPAAADSGTFAATGVVLDSAGNVVAADSTAADLSGADVIRSLQAQAATLAATSDASASSTTLSDFLRSSVLSATAGDIGLFA